MGLFINKKSVTAVTKQSVLNTQFYRVIGFDSSNSVLYLNKATELCTYRSTEIMTLQRT